ncbi:MAG TPA: GTP 3',8-cyclase MoaA [Myxococcaceae bacterium]|nr:GTP 3',8-cyclase MoaA [Myxococcaceae bacterium]
MTAAVHVPPQVPRVTDALGRPLRSLRLSVTDRCNLRCNYCMPEPDYAWLPKDALLTVEELVGVASLFVESGVDRIRVTGGEPLLRPDLPELVGRLSRLSGVRDLALTTNGVLLEAQAQALFSAGLHRVTVSLDTLRPERFLKLTRRDLHGRVLAGIQAARSSPGGLKLDAVVMRGFNDDELGELIEYGKAVSAEVRFIEYMDVGGATHWSPEKVVSGAEILSRLGRRYGTPRPAPTPPSAPATRYALSDGTVFGVIASVTTPFCRSCDRSRLTADGTWYHCLYAARGRSLRERLRAGTPREEMRRLLQTDWAARRDRGAEARAALTQRSPLPTEALRRDVRLEMHARGG